MAEKKQYKISKWLHRPYQVLFFDSEDLGVIFFFFMLAFLFGKIFWLFLFIFPYLILKKKKRSPRGYIKHLLYLTGLYRFKNCPTVFESRFYE